MKYAFRIVAVSAIILLLAAGIGFTQDDVAKHPSCKYCGMDRKVFAHSRTLVTYDDGSQVGTCSIHCLAVDLSLNIDKTPAMLQVGDFKTRDLIDAETASWVIGGSKQGVMTKRAKWAFKNKADADLFIKENGGSPGTFDQAMKATYEDMYADTKMIREKRKMMKKTKAPAEKKQ
jgi:nitrous oxide reductase accessory protein NosL